MAELAGGAGLAYHVIMAYSPSTVNAVKYGAGMVLIYGLTGAMLLAQWLFG